MPRILLILLMILSSTAASSQALDVSVLQAAKLSDAARLLVDPHKTLSFAEIRQSNQFVAMTDQMQFGYQRGRYWLHQQLTHTGEHRKELLLVLDDPTVALSSVYLVTSGRIVFADSGGSADPDPNRRFRKVVFPLTLEPATSYDLYVAYENHNVIRLHMRLLDPAVFAEENQASELVLGLYYGCAAALLFFNLFLFLAVRDRSYLTYCIFVCSTMFSLLTIDGILGVIAPSIDWQLFSTATANLTVFTALLFTRTFLKTKEYIPRLDRFVVGLKIYLMIASGVTFAGYTLIASYLCDLGIIMGCITVIACGVLAIRAGYKPARYYLLAWIVLSPFTVIWNLMMYGVLPFEFFTIHGIHLGSALEMILMSIALGERINSLTAAKIRAERRLETNLALIKGTQMIAHDVRKPFNMLNVMFERLLSSPNDHVLADRARAAIDPVSQAVRHASTLLTDLLQYGKSVELNPIATPVPDLLNEVVALSRASSDKKSISVKVNAADGLKFYLDRDRMQRVIVNLVDNAIDATPPGGEIILSAQQSGRDDLIGVHNSGSFIPQDQRRKVFDAFYTSGKARGTGLGLMICKDIVSKHGGTIEVDSDQILGTTFHIRLHRPKSIPQANIKSTVPGKEPYEKPVLVVIDDDPFMLAAWSEAIKDARVYTFLAPDDFLESNLKPVNAVISDLMFAESDEPVSAEMLSRVAARTASLFLSTNLPEIVPDLGLKQPLPVLEKRPYHWHELDQLTKSKR